MRKPKRESKVASRAERARQKPAKSLFQEAVAAAQSILDAKAPERAKRRLCPRCRAEVPRHMYLRKAERSDKRTIRHRCVEYPPHIMAIVYGKDWEMIFPRYKYRDRLWFKYSESKRSAFIKKGRGGDAEEQ